jgi:hypothetical protein
VINRFVYRFTPHFSSVFFFIFFLLLDKSSHIS